MSSFVCFSICENYCTLSVEVPRKKDLASSIERSELLLEAEGEKLIQDIRYEPN